MNYYEPREIMNPITTMLVIINERAIPALVITILLAVAIGLVVYSLLKK